MAFRGVVEGGEEFQPTLNTSVVLAKPLKSFVVGRGVELGRPEITTQKLGALTDAVSFKFEGSPVDFRD